MKTNHRKSINSVFGTSLVAMVLIFALVSGKIYAQWNNNTLVNMLISTLPTADMQQV